MQREDHMPDAGASEALQAEAPVELDEVADEVDEEDYDADAALSAGAFRRLAMLMEVHAEIQEQIDEDESE